MFGVDNCDLFAIYLFFPLDHTQILIVSLRISASALLVDTSSTSPAGIRRWASTLLHAPYASDQFFNYNDMASTMKAVVFHGPLKVALEDRPIPKIQEPTDVVVKVAYTALCGR